MIDCFVFRRLFFCFLFFKHKQTNALFGDYSRHYPWRYWQRCVAVWCDTFDYVRHQELGREAGRLPFGSAPRQSVFFEEFFYRILCFTIQTIC